MSDPAGSTSFAYCPQPRHGLVPGILGTCRNHFGPEQSHLECNAWTLFQCRRLRHRTSSWNLILGSSRKRTCARRKIRGHSGFSSDHGGRRAAVYLCLFGDSEHMRPMGIYTNLDEICNVIHLGWPELVTTALDQGTSLSFSGPLQKACSCVQRHKAFRGTSSDGSFLSQSAPGLSSKLWRRCFC